MIVNKSEFFEVKRSGIPKMLHGSIEYIEWWTEQHKRCKEGYTVGGVWCPPTLYFYGNFAHILDNDPTKDRRRKSKVIPDVSDLEWELAFIYDECKNEPNKLRNRHDKTYNLEGPDKLYRPLEAGTKGACIVGCRDSGKSYFAGAGLAAWEYTFFPDNEIVISASISDYTRDILTKTKLTIDNFAGSLMIPGIKKDETIPPPFYHNRVRDDWSEEVRSGKILQGTTTNIGFNTVLWNIVYGDNSMAANGKRPSLHIFEEAGAWEGSAQLVDCYTHSIPCWMRGTEQFSVPWVQGTGGNMKRGTTGLRKLFKEGEQYNMLTFEDKYEGKGKIGYFIPDYMGARQFKKPDGNTDIVVGKAHYDGQRAIKEKSSDPKVYLNYIMYYPRTWSEAFLKTGSQIFPTRLLQSHLSNIEGSQLLNDMERKGFFELENGVPTWKEDNNLVPCVYPTASNQDLEGCWSVMELPEEYPANDMLYIAGTDPTTQDEATTSNSVNSTFVFKTFDVFGKTYMWPVAEYSARPPRSEIYYENVRVGLMAYNNAVDLYENQTKNFMTFMKSKNALHLLLEQPDELIKEMIKSSKVDRKFGIHMTDAIKRQLEEYTRDWLLEEYAPGRYNLQKVYFKELLKELIDYEVEGNYDRVIAFMLIIAQLKQIQLTGMTSNSDRKEQEDEFLAFFEEDIYRK